MDVSKEPLRIPPIHQSPSELILSVRDNDIARRFTVLRQQRFSIGQNDFVFSIIGESHIATVYENGAVRLQEILACTDLANPVHRFRNLNDYIYDRGDYYVAVSFRSEAQCRVNAPGIEVIFPEIWGQQPITRIQWRIHEDCVQWWTLHTYPDQDGSTYVYTKSRLKGIFDG